MRRYILFFTFIFFISVNLAQAQRPTPTGGCVQESDCYRFEYLGATQVEDGLMQLRFGLQVSCDELAYIAFEVPEGSEAAGPADTYHQDASNYIVRNGFTSEQGPNEIETPFNAIQFNAKQTYSLSGGAVDTFMFNLTETDFEALSTMRVRATLRSGTNGNRDIVSGSRQVVFDLDACSPTGRPDACVIERDLANFAFVGATDNGDGTTTVRLQIQNKAEADVSSITIETEDTPEEISVAGLNGGNMYHTDNFVYMVTVDQAANLVTFDAQNTSGYANNVADVFALVVPNDLYELAPYFVMSVSTEETFESAGLNTISCEDEPITPLPVELASFEGRATQSGIVLEWTTASEKNNDRFEVERSQDGKSFEKVAEVKGAGNSVITQTYSYTDKAAGAGLRYYRLKQVDFDGQFEFSKVVAVESVAASASMEVYPNPASGNNLQVAMQNNSDALLQIMDRNGRTVYTQKVGAGAQQVQLSIPELNIPKGLYYVHLQSSEGGQVQKLIVQ